MGTLFIKNLSIFLLTISNDYSGFIYVKMSVFDIQFSEVKGFGIEESLDATAGEFDSRAILRDGNLT